MSQSVRTLLAFLAGVLITVFASAILVSSIKGEYDKTIRDKDQKIEMLEMNYDQLQEDRETAKFAIEQGRELIKSAPDILEKSTDLLDKMDPGALLDIAETMKSLEG